VDCGLHALIWFDLMSRNRGDGCKVAFRHACSIKKFIRIENSPQAARFQSVMTERKNFPEKNRILA
jgi:hypothetical protein